MTHIDRSSDTLFDEWIAVDTTDTFDEFAERREHENSHQYVPPPRLPKVDDFRALADAAETARLCRINKASQGR